jgi:hypothetical protein
MRGKKTGKRSMSVQNRLILFPESFFWDITAFLGRHYFVDSPMFICYDGKALINSDQ